MMTTHIVLMMNAVPFTVGHEFIISYLSNLQFYSEHKKHLFVAFSENEPISLKSKRNAAQKIVNDCADPISLRMWYPLENLPRAEPLNENDSEYWKALFGMMISRIGINTSKDNIIFLSSELYSEEMVKWWRILISPFAKSIVADQNRVFSSARATNIRKDPFTFWDDISRFEQPLHRKKLIMFGAESVGKTTLARKISSEMNWDMTDEWARPYLESKEDKTIDETVMANIVQNQIALEKTSNMTAKTPIIVRDTDIVSTYGYYLIAFMMKASGFAKEAAIIAATDPNNYYVVLKQDNVPFIRDPLRFGGDKRESEDQFWIDLLATLNAKNAIVIDPTNQDDVDLIVEKVIGDFDHTFENYSRPK